MLRETRSRTGILPHRHNALLTPLVAALAVGVADLLMLLSAWGTCADPANCPADLSPPDGDGAVGVGDLLFLLQNWG